MPFPYAGELAGLTTALCWTITALAFESAGRRIGSLAVNHIRLVIAFFILSAVCWVHRGLPLPTDATPHAWIWLSVSGLVGFTIGDLCLFRALVIVGSRTATLIMALVPPITALIGWAVIGEILSVLELLGMALTLSGVAIVILERRPDRKGEKRKLPIEGILLGLGGAVGQAVGLVLSKYGMGSYDALAAVQIRIIAGIAGFSVLFLFIGWWPKIFKAVRDPSAMKGTALGAFFGPFLGVTFSLIAVKYTETGVAATLMALAPVFIIPPAIFIQKERVSTRAVLGAIVAVTGSGLLFL
ncbi:MAG: DMT family transporter [Deltaproteobacteria bacterium]|nr:DMT family transporter [Deltaproteobacteria bacterium]